MKLTLLDWCKQNVEQGNRILNEWTGIDIENNRVDITKISYGSNKKMLWRCSNTGCNNEWYTMIVNRTSAHRNCPVCADMNRGKTKRVTDNNSLLNWCKNNDREILLKEFGGITDENIPINIHDVSYGSKKRVLWVCSKCKHKWYTAVKHRTINNSGCPACSGSIVTDRNSLLTWCYNNGEHGKRLFLEFGAKDIDNNNINIEDISYGSNMKVLWHCSNSKCQKDWYATVKHRTGCNSGCPMCSASNTSYAEQFIFLSLKQIYPDAKNRYRINNTEIDIIIPSIKLCIEYSPTYWHNGKEEKDEAKKQLCLRNGYNYLRIVEDSYNNMEELEDIDLIVIKMIESKKDEILRLLVNRILTRYRHSITEIDTVKVHNDAYNAMKVKCTKQDSLYNKYPVLANEWHTKLNGNITPDIVSYGSNSKAYWVCPMCKYGENGEWYRSPNNRTARGGHGCPKCGYNWAKLSSIQ